MLPRLRDRSPLRPCGILSYPTVSLSYPTVSLSRPTVSLFIPDRFARGRAAAHLHTNPPTRSSPGFTPPAPLPDSPLSDSADDDVLRTVCFPLPRTAGQAPQGHRRREKAYLASQSKTVHLGLLLRRHSCRWVLNACVYDTSYTYLYGVFLYVHVHKNLHVDMCTHIYIYSHTS